MTKKEIVMNIADRTDIRQVKVKKIVQMVLDAIVDSLVKGETVELRNFGIFKVRKRKSRIARNPKTGQSVTIPEKRVVSFKSGLVMKEKVR
ncbi:MAG: HU family DNA-binding protein [Candidatus Omnitrophota bacterium]